MKSARTLLVTLSLAGLVSAHPAAAGALRSAEALPVFSAKYISTGGERDDDEVRCLKIDRVKVKVDEFDRPILDAAGKMIRCRPGAGGFPWGALAGLIVIPLGLFAAGGGGGGNSGNGGPDSPG